MRIPSAACAIAGAVRSENTTAKVRNLTVTLPPEASASRRCELKSRTTRFAECGGFSPRTSAAAGECSREYTENVTTGPFVAERLAAPVCRDTRELTERSHDRRCLNRRVVRGIRDLRVRC